MGEGICPPPPPCRPHLHATPPSMQTPFPPGADPPPKADPLPPKGQTDAYAVGKNLYLSIRLLYCDIRIILFILLLQKDRMKRVRKNQATNLIGQNLTRNLIPRLVDSIWMFVLLDVIRACMIIPVPSGRKGSCFLTC